MVTEYQVETSDEQQRWRPLVDHCRSTSVVVPTAGLPDAPCFRVRAVNKHGCSAPGLEAAAPPFCDEEPAERAPAAEVEEEERDGEQGTPRGGYGTRQQGTWQAAGVGLGREGNAMECGMTGMGY